MESEDCTYIGNYSEHGLLGEGGQADVYLCREKKNFFAAKVYQPGNSKVQAFKKEAEFLSKLNFKNLINMVGSNLDTKVKLQGKDEVVRPVIYLEFAQGGELFDYIAKVGRFTPEICRSLTKSILDAIEYLQSVGVSHRDLKPENILFDKDYILKVSDFGLSTLSVGANGDGYLHTRVGTEGYKPPEVEEGNYTGIQTDLFAVGVILFVMYSGNPPFLSTKPLDKIYKLIKQKKWETFWSLHEKKKPAGFYPDSFKRLLNSFFSAEVDKRPSLESLKEDEWLTGDDVMQSDIVTEMSKRHEIILQGDEKKRAVELERLAILKNTMDEEDECGERDLDIDDKKSFEVISLASLPKSSNPNLIIGKATPNIALTWINDYMNEAFKNKNTFLKDEILTIRPINYSVSAEEDEIKISLMFETLLETEADEQPEEEELTILVHFYQVEEEDKVGVHFEKKSGNSFWLAAVVAELDEQIRILG